MSTTVDQSRVYATLRNKAEALLHAGTTPAAGHWTMGVDALSLLHRLSSSPDRAEDALKLLHELQVHQVELDVQNEEVAANERALEEELQAYRALYECAPLGYCVVDHEGVIIQANTAAAELFGVDGDDMEGQRIGTFLNSQNAPVLLDVLQRVVRGEEKAACVVEINGGAREVQFLASLAPGGEQILLACSERVNVA